MSPRKAPRPGLVLDVDASTPPVLFHHGENFKMEKLPVGRSRIIYPCLLYTSPSPRDRQKSRMPSSA